MRPVIELRGVAKLYGTEESLVRAVDGVDLVVERGDYVAVMGASGSGKSTLMNIIGCLDAPSRGRYLLDGVDVRRLDERRQAIVRNRKIGFVFQSFNLIPFKTALENVALPLYYQRVGRSRRNRQAMELLERLGLADWASHRPSELSGGQQQRIAIARAIITSPKILLADEPTGALDSATSVEVMDVLRAVNRDGVTAVLVTHERDVAARCDRTIQLRDGLVVGQEAGA